MAKPTAGEIQKLEAEHKTEFVDLVLANRLFLKLLPRIKGKSKTSKEYLAVLNLGKVIARLAGSWYARQKDYEIKSGIPKADPSIMKYFLVPAEENKLIAQAKNYINPAKYDPMFNPMGEYKTISGIGIIPLIIWAVIALIAAYTATQIADHFNTTAKERSDLLAQTTATLKDLGITGEQAANIINQTQSSSPSGGGLFSGGFTSLLMWGAIAYGTYKIVIEPKSKAATK